MAIEILVCSYSIKLHHLFLNKGLICETFILSGTVPLSMHLFIIRDIVGEITADSILIWDEAWNNYRISKVQSKSYL